MIRKILGLAIIAVMVIFTAGSGRVEAGETVAWGEKLGNMSVGIEVDADDPLKITGHVKYEGSEPAKIQITEASLDWKVIFVAATASQGLSYQGEDSFWWDAYPFHKDRDFALEPTHSQVFDFNDKKWLFNPFNPTNGEKITDQPQQEKFPAGTYQVQLEFTAAEPLNRSEPGKAGLCPRSAFTTITVKPAAAASEK